MPHDSLCFRNHNLLPASILFLTTFLIFLATAKAEPPDSIGAVAPTIPDSVSLDNKVVYVDFWASWCPPCRMSFPWMQSLAERYREKGFEIVAVSVDHDHDAAERFLAGMDASFPIVFDSTGSLAKQFELQAMPTSFLFGRDGKLVTSHVGFQPKDTLELDSIIVDQIDREAGK